MNKGWKEIAYWKLQSDSDFLFSLSFVFGIIFFFLQFILLFINLLYMPSSGHDYNQ